MYSIFDILCEMWISIFHRNSENCSILTVYLWKWNSWIEPLRTVRIISNLTTFHKFNFPSAQNKCADALRQANNSLRRNRFTELASTRWCLNASFSSIVQAGYFLLITDCAFPLPPPCLSYDGRKRKWSHCSSTCGGKLRSGLVELLHYIGWFYPFSLSRARDLNGLMLLALRFPWKATSF